MTEDPSRRHLGEVPLQDVQVAATDSRGVDPNNSIGVVNECRIRNFVPALVVGPVIDECFHGVTLSLVECCVGRPFHPSSGWYEQLDTPFVAGATRTQR